MRLHLDPLGGVAGDMFVAAVLDAWPELEAPAVAAIRAAGVPDGLAIRLLADRDGSLIGHRFAVQAPRRKEAHTAWQAIRRQLEQAPLAPGVRARAIAMFEHLALAEAQVHGIASEAVRFHEVGALDSLADIVAAASLIEALGAEAWSVGALPLGRGRIQSAHGTLPVPAPATVRLLEGFVMIDDGLEGERVTPTGAAILRHLEPAFGMPAMPLRLARHGHGFGTQRFYQTPNLLRILAFEPVEALGDPPGRDLVGVIRFEVDDQTGEDLALGLERVRGAAGVLDVLQAPAFGKKGRMVVQVQVLTRPDALEAVVRACFRETTTLGLRTALEERRVLARWPAGDPGGTRVKLAERPGGLSAKAEIDDLVAADGREDRERIRAQAEDRALAQESEDG